MGKYDKYLQDQKPTSKYADIIAQHVEKPKSMADIIKGGLKSYAKATFAPIAEMQQGAITGLVRWAGNIWWMIPLPWLWEKFKQSAEWTAQMLEKGVQRFGFNPQSIPSKVWQFAGESTLTAPIWALPFKATSIAWKVWLGALQWVLQGWATDIVSRGQIWAWAIAWWVLWAAAPWIQKAGEALYKTAFKPSTTVAEKIIQAKATGGKLPITTGDTALKYWITGTQTWVWVKWVKAANKIFSKRIEPAFKRADKAWVKIDYSWLMQQAKNNISKSKFFSDTQKQEILDNIDEIAKLYKWTTSLKNLDLEKQAIVSKIPKKYIWVVKTPKELTAAQNEISSVFRKTVHDMLKKKFWVDSARLYKDYANLKELEKIWVKWLTTNIIPEGGTFTGLSWIYNALATPVKTIGWKVLYKVWKWLEFTWPKGIKSISDLARKAGYKLVGDTITKITWQ